jgi:quinol monooxygenase YgiN
MVWHRKGRYTMYGTVARMKVKPGARKELMAWAEKGGRRPGSGGVAVYVFQMDANANEYYAVAIFESEEAYKANAEHPDTNQGFRTMMQYLEEEPEWHDGKVIFSEKLQ